MLLQVKNKQFEKGKIVTTFAMGTKELYEFMDMNPAIAIMDGAWTNDPYTIARNDNQISINTTLEVDFTGQCASESLGSKQFSGNRRPGRYGDWRSNVKKW